MLRTCPVTSRLLKWTHRKTETRKRNLLVQKNLEITAGSMMTPVTNSTKNMTLKLNKEFKLSTWRSMVYNSLTTFL